MILEKTYELARDQIKHEDGLVNNRVTWVLVFHGFLFSAVFQALALFENASLPLPVHKSVLVVALCLLCVVGVASSLVAASAVAAAHEHIAKVKDWWEAQAGLQSQFPPFMGGQGTSILGVPLSGPTFLRGLAAIWLALGCLLSWAAWQ